MTNWLPFPISPGIEAFLSELLVIPAAFLVFLVTARLLVPIIWWTMGARNRVRGERMNPQRATTLQSLLNSIGKGAGVFAAIVFVMSRYIPASAVATTLGLFSAGVGFAARPFISDVLGGLVLLFEDQYSVGEKVEIGDRNVIGVVERVSLRVTAIRGEAGELWIVPNGDVRTLRNFSRASFSPANVRITVPTASLDETLAILEDIRRNPGIQLVEMPEIISEQGVIGEQTELMLKIKAPYSSGPGVRRHFLALVQQRLIERQILAQTNEQDTKS